MGQQDYFNQLQIAISDTRLATYTGNSHSRTYGAYAWNIAICESLYPAIHCVEVTLRNSIHGAAANLFGDQYWFRSHLAPGEQAGLSRLTQDLRRRRTPVEVGDFVSGFTFGFWVNLFNANYEQSLWPQLIRPVFPGVPRRQRARSQLFHRLDTIRRLRNRVFHHEPIWHWTDLAEQHELIIETIDWINPEMRQFVEMLDRFPETYARGAEFYEQELLSVFQS